MSREAIFSSQTMRISPALSPSPLGRVHGSLPGYSPRKFYYSSLVASYPTAWKIIVSDGLRQLDIQEQRTALCHFASPAEVCIVS